MSNIPQILCERQPSIDVPLLSLTSDSVIGMSSHSSAARLCRPAGLHRDNAPTLGWFDDSGAPVTDEHQLSLLRALHIPPAWRDVWASPDPQTKVQATGVDARGRTQYRYSTVAQQQAAEQKFANLLPFGNALPQLRTQVDWHLSFLTEDTAAHRVKRATAAAVRLIDKGLFRVGSDRYARDNHTYGLTTLTRDHVRVSGDEIQFTFVGKEHRPWNLVIEDEQVAEIVAELLSGASDDVPFLAVPSADGGRYVVNSAAVNSYIHGATSSPATAKTFRTWGGTAAAAAVSAGASPPITMRSSRADLIAYDAAAHLLGNTRAVARHSYVHPRAIEAGQASAVSSAISESTVAAGTGDVRVLLRDDAVVSALVDELTRLSIDSV
jgi:DNA topoisomerase-1